MKILLTVNGTAKSESIIPFVVELARHWQAEVLLARAIDPLVGMGDPLVPLVAESFYEEMVRAGEEYLKDLQPRFQGIPLRNFCLVGSPGECIRELAVQEGCDLLVMASHGHTGFVRWLWGSVAEGMARSAPCPVLLVRRETPAPIRRVLVPVDDSVASWKVVDRLNQWLDPAESTVTVLHCGNPEEVAGLDRAAESKPWVRLEFTATKAPLGIHQWLADNSCDLVAMATRGREGLAHLWTGSVMEQVARQADCPVLVFPPSLEQ